MKATTTQRTPTIGFGYPTDGWPPHYTVTISRSRRDPVVLTEDDDAASWVGEGLCKRLDRATWDKLAVALAGELNVRPKSANLTPGLWKVGSNKLDRTLGKEVELLIMAVGDQEFEDIPAVLANWRGLTPEERWWLHGNPGRPTIIRAVHRRVAAFGDLGVPNIHPGSPEDTRMTDTKASQIVADHINRITAGCVGASAQFQALVTTLPLRSVQKLAAWAGITATPMAAWVFVGCLRNLANR